MLLHNDIAAVHTSLVAIVAVHECGLNQWCSQGAVGRCRPPKVSSAKIFVVVIFSKSSDISRTTVTLVNFKLLTVYVCFGMVFI